MLNGNGKKPSWLAYINIIGIIALITVILKVGVNWGSLDTNSLLMAQDVKDNQTAIKVNYEKAEVEHKAMNDTLSKHNTKIEVVVVRMDNLADKVEAQTVEQKTTNGLLLELIQRMPPE